MTEAPDQIEHASASITEAPPRKRGRPKKELSKVCTGSVTTEPVATESADNSELSNDRLAVSAAQIDAVLATLDRIATALESGNRISSQVVIGLKSISIAVDDLGEVL